jgi:hypothetical protein
MDREMRRGLAESRGRRERLHACKLAKAEDIPQSGAGLSPASVEVRSVGPRKIKEAGEEA